MIWGQNYRANIFQPSFVLFLFIFLIFLFITDKSFIKKKFIEVIPPQRPSKVCQSPLYYCYLLQLPEMCFNTCCKTSIISNMLKLLNTHIQCFCLILGAPCIPCISTKLVTKHHCVKACKCCLNQRSQLFPRRNNSDIMIWFDISTIRPLITKINIKHP